MSELTVAQGLAQARAQGVDRLDAQMLLCALLGQPRSWLLGHDTDPLPPDTTARFTELVARRAQGEPLAYLVGDKEFYGLSLNVAPGVLVPRPDTETLVDWALDVLPAEAPTRVLDLGTGSGAIALAVRSRRPHASLTAVDASPEALAIASGNARRLNLPLELLAGSWFEPVGTRQFELILSNPPYIAEGDPHLPALRFEPRQALTAGPDGLDDLRHIVAAAPAHLVPGGWLLLEHGYDQARQVQALLREAGFDEVSTRHDLAGQPRCTGGRWRG
ncbi:peptide chain release factor N(5)-glutamine methyltransferase [Aquabacterium soli]|uniref:Release factor glutamine methyltransferase n=1 Tax=Aquabacterium soli TaxID=2493092 RepID=A0A426VCM1_9BURK|nr:peptide chain release factor N(5)-glutamine methyltransferase [Aquabacterium soli]RRS04530.1 peptide chain release factor N(5)-glutamine methyltransferase [Aquabacterium soli]